MYESMELKRAQLVLLDFRGYWKGSVDRENALKRTHTHTDTHTYTLSHTRTHIDTHTYTHTRTHTHVQTYSTHERIHTQALTNSSQNVFPIIIEWVHTLSDDRRTDGYIAVAQFICPLQ